MTGEISLHGQVREIGGLKEKAIAAHSSELKTIFIPKENEKDIDDIPIEVREELKIIKVEEYSEIWSSILTLKPEEEITFVKKDCKQEEATLSTP